MDPSVREVRTCPIWEAGTVLSAAPSRVGAGRSNRSQGSRSLVGSTAPPNKFGVYQTKSDCGRLAIPSRSQIPRRMSRETFRSYCTSVAQPPEATGGVTHFSARTTNSGVRVGRSPTLLPSPRLQSWDPARQHPVRLINDTGPHTWTRPDNPWSGKPNNLP